MIGVVQDLHDAGEVQAISGGHPIAIAAQGSHPPLYAPTGIPVERASRSSCVSAARVRGSLVLIERRGTRPSSIDASNRPCSSVNCGGTASPIIARKLV